MSLMSSAPLPQIHSSSIFPEKGSRSHCPSVPATTGTTSWWAMSMAGSREESVPGSVSRTDWPTSSKVA